MRPNVLIVGSQPQWFMVGRRFLPRSPRREGPLQQHGTHMHLAAGFLAEIDGNLPPLGRQDPAGDFEGVFTATGKVRGAGS